MIVVRHTLMKFYPQNCKSEFPILGTLNSQFHLEALVSIHNMLPRLVLLMKLVIESWARKSHFLIFPFSFC